MKKTTLIALALLLMPMLFSSCYKDYRCSCSALDTVNKRPIQFYQTLGGEQNAENRCSQQRTNYLDSGYTQVMCGVPI
jgi:hypothetical protein